MGAAIFRKPEILNNKLKELGTETYFSVVIAKTPNILLSEVDCTNR